MIGGAIDTDNCDDDGDDIWRGVAYLEDDTPGDDWWGKVSEQQEGPRWKSLPLARSTTTNLAWLASAHAHTCLPLSHPQLKIQACSPVNELPAVQSGLARVFVDFDQVCHALRV